MAVVAVVEIILGPVPLRWWLIIGVACPTLAVIMYFAELTVWFQGHTSSPKPMSIAKAPVKPAFDQDIKEFINHPAAELCRDLKGLTDLASKRLTKPYEGKWLRVQGIVKDVTDLTSVIDVEMDEVSGVAMHMEFSIRWYSHLSAIKHNDVIFAIGKISRVMDTMVFLKDCELRQDHL